MLCRSWRGSLRTLGQAKGDPHHQLGKIPNCKRTTSWMTLQMKSMTDADPEIQLISCISQGHSDRMHIGFIELM